MSIVPRARAAPARERASPPLPEGSFRADRKVALGFAAFGALATCLTLFQWETRQGDLETRARRSGLPESALVDAVRSARRELDPANARLEIARALLDRELLARELEGAASLDRLAEARKLASEALTRQPANPEAAMILGATLELERSRLRDTRLFSHAVEWERPLERAVALAPGSRRPKQLLAAAYLDVWPALSPAKHAIAVELLRDAFEDPPTFERLYAPWIVAAGSLEKASELLPDQPKSWRKLAETARGRGNFAELELLLSRYRSSLAADFSRELDRVAAGNPPRPGFFAELFESAPLDLAFAPIVERGLALRPAGPASSQESRAARTWFQWAAPLCLVRGCPFAGAALGRLASLAGGLLAPEQSAFAAFAAGDFARANLLERRAESIWSESWAPYLTLKAMSLAKAGDDAAARAALAQTHRAFRARIPWREAAELAHIREAATPGLHPPARTAWEAADWWFDRGSSRLDLLPARPAAALVLEPGTALAKGALLEILWDGNRLPLARIPAGDASVTALRVALSSPGASPEPHLLEVRPLVGDLRPAMRVRLD